jgi:DNA-binding CsgD family transcriptional regulator
MSTDVAQAVHAAHHAVREWTERRQRPDDGAPEGRRRTALSGMLDQIDYGALLVGADLTVLHANAAARAEIERGHPLAMRAGSVLVVHETCRLVSAVEGAVRRSVRCCIALPCGSGSTVVAVMPVDWPGGRAAMLLMERRTVCPPLSIQCFASVYGLSGAESRLLALLCEGTTPAEMARIHGVSVSTIRSQISSLRAKTGASSLRELLRRVAALPPMAGLLLQSLTS